MENYFEKLSRLNVSEHLERKGQFAYLSWPYAVEQLRLADPAATWEVKRFEGMPYLKTECGYFVEVAVTVQGVTLSQVHPVLDAKNRPIELPNSFEINTSIQRCLVKAIALHGLGLYVYAGEDLPQGTENVENREKTQPKPPAAAAGTLGREQIAAITALLAETGTSRERLLAFFRVESLERIPATEYGRVIQTLERAKRRAA
ncbi:MAG TPA: DUF1071 domain-containing protein [Solirubrobacteraceae bacterium]|nr:DUF1071 domain-containing protein [Solirubrobacteraceae bacterium]